jgi:2-dehydro-3-deoxyphosphogluconate aldolase/(4S)-4-hydroxy-2-oxoglutarate aldolase
MKVIETMEYSGIVPVFYHGEPETAKNVVRACYKGGMRVFEFTNRGEKAYEVFRALVEMVACECPELILGIGSIVDAANCRKFIDAGAKFIVSPILSAEVMETAKAAGIPYVPGCATPTEIYTAQRLGAEIVKVFPAAEVGGPAFVKAVLAPMSWSKIMVTGGVEPTRENLKGWFGAGVKCVGIGSNLFPKEVVAAENWNEISRICADALTTVKELRK